MEEAVKEGITSFKCFLVYKKEGWMVSDGTLAKLMLRAKELGAMINVHAENPDLIDMYTEQVFKRRQDECLVSLHEPAGICGG